LLTVFLFSAYFRINSDIQYHYGTFYDKDTRQKVGHSKFVQWKRHNLSYVNEELLETVRNKSKIMAIFVSNCHDYAQRLDLIRSLKKHIPVDIYGYCGNLR
jgi:hypothetical protein